MYNKDKQPSFNKSNSNFIRFFFFLRKAICQHSMSTFNWVWTITSSGNPGNGNGDRGMVMVIPFWTAIQCCCTLFMKLEKYLWLNKFSGGHYTLDRCPHLSLQLNQYVVLAFFNLCSLQKICMGVQIVQFVWVMGVKSATYPNTNTNTY